MDDEQTKKDNGITLYVYPGGSFVDEDRIWEEDGKEIFLPKKSAILYTISIRMGPNFEVFQPEATFGYNKNYHKIPLRYVYFNGELKDFETGMESGIFLFPKVENLEGNNFNLNQIGATLYLSQKTINSLLVRLYLFDEKPNYFKNTHTESNFIVKELKTQGLDYGEFVYYEDYKELQGPIKIWEIDYPSDMQLNEDYLKTDFPSEDLSKAKEGAFGQE